jgi:SAM-dependent methyltransferase
MLDGSGMTSCPLDGATLIPGAELFRDNRFGLPHTVRIAWCPSCGLGVTLDPPSQRELDTLYTECYTDDGPPQLPGTSRAARIWHRLNGSVPVADRQLEPPVLDVGCNTGEVLALLRSRGLEVMGVEPNPTAAAAARAKGIEVVVSPIESAPLPDQRFGSAILSQVLEHVHDPQAVLRRVRPSLVEGSRIYVVVPNAESVWRHLFGTDWVHWHVPFHLWHHTRTSLSLLLEQSGFDLEEARTFTPGEWLLMSLEARRNRRRGVYRLTPFRGRFGRRLALAPMGRLGDALGRGDALFAVARVITPG